MVDPQPRSSSNRARMLGTGMRKRKRRKRLNWFPPVEATLERTLIQKPISVLLKNCPPEASPTTYNGGGGPLLISQLLRSTSLHFLPLPF